jgi:hypothetical protein
MTPARLGGIIARLPAGLSEIYLHPAIQAYPGSGPGYRHDVELGALVDPAVVAAARSSPDLALGGYADFAAQAERRRWP